MKVLQLILVSVFLFFCLAACSSTIATIKEGCATPRTPVSVERKAFY